MTRRASRPRRPGPRAHAPAARRPGGGGRGGGGVGEALRHYALGLPRVRLDAPVELARQPASCVLALGLDRVRELLGRGVGVAGGAPGHRPFELLDLPPFHVREARLDAPRGFGLLALDLLSKRPLPAAEPLVELVERAPPLALRGLELGARRRRGLLHHARELLAQPRDGRAKLFRLALDALRVAPHPRLDLGEQLLLALGEPCDLRREALLGALEILTPGGQTPLDAPLRLRQRLAEPCAGFVLAVGHLLPARLGDAALLVEEERRRLGPCPREHALELGGVCRGFASNKLAQLLLCAARLVVDPADTGQCSPYAGEARLDGRGDGEARGGDGYAAGRIEREHDPR